MSITAAKRRANRAAAGTIRGLSRWEEDRLRKRLRRAAASEPWVDAQVCTVVGSGVRVHDPTTFPPGGVRETGMRWCRACGRWTPGPAVSLVESRDRHGGPVTSATVTCDDCRIAEEASVHRELFAAFPNLRPAGSKSFVGRRELLADRAHGRG